MDEPIERLSHTFPWALPYDERFNDQPLKPKHFYNDDTVSVWTKLDDSSGWRVSMVFALRGGVIELVDVRLHPSEATRLEDVPSGGITRRMLAAVPLGELVAQARRTFSSEVVIVDGKWMMRTTALLYGKRWADAPTATEPRSSGRRRRGRPDEFYAEAAEAYVRHRDAGHAAPRKAVGAELGIPAKLMPDVMRAARQRGMLEGAARGRNEGQLTDKARLILAGDADGHGKR